MRAAFKAVGFALVLLLLAAAGFAWVNREEVGRLWAVQKLFSPDRIVWNFTHMGELFYAVPLDLGRQDVVGVVPEGMAVDLPPGAEAVIAERRITGIMVLSDGAVSHESYYLGTGPEDLRISWSVAKSFMSALIGILIDDGVIESLDDPVTHYAPSLQGTGYDGASVRDVLWMASGLEFDETYSDFWSDISRMGRVLALGGSLDLFTRSFEATVAPPGTEWHYVSIDTQVLGLVIRGATGQPVAEVMAERLLAPMGVAPGPYLLTDAHGTGFVMGGLNMRLRDYALFGLMFQQDGRLGERRLVPWEWVEESTRPSAPTEPGALRYGYHWWMPRDGEGEALAFGIYGQYIYINREASVVIAASGADPDFRRPEVRGGMIDWFREITRANLEARE